MSEALLTDCFWKCLLDNIPLIYNQPLNLYILDNKDYTMSYAKANNCLKASLKKFI